MRNPFNRERRYSYTTREGKTTTATVTERRLRNPFRRRKVGHVTEYYDPETGSRGLTVDFPDGGGPRGFDPDGFPGRVLTAGEVETFVVIRRDPTPEA